MYSFDVFDTLITRRTATPWGIFALIQDSLKENKNFSTHITNNFYELRIHAEELARANNEFNSIEEVTIENIYDALAMTGCITLEERRMLINLEKEMEITNIIGIEENIRQVEDLIARGERVVLISDMYLDQDTIRKMLVKTNGIFRDIPIYVSSEFLKRKQSGNLYRIVKDREKIDYTDWIHCGNDLNQDIEVPINLGIYVKHYKAENLTGLEARLIEQYSNNSQLQIILGTAKNVRKMNLLSSTAAKIGASYSGPVLYGYTDWILSEAIRKGIKRLYFIARDGYLVKAVADIIIKKNHYDIKTFYIYGSRKAWRIPSLSEEYFDLYQTIKWSHTAKIKTISNLAEVLLITAEELFPFLPKGCRKADLIISNQVLQYLAFRLNSDHDFKKYLLKKTVQIRKLVINYLEQEIDCSDDNFAFVEVSGGGFTQGCLKRLLEGIYNKPIRTFFFKIDRINLVEGCINDTFIPSFVKNNLVMEMICRAPHGQTRGYKKSDDKVIPILEDKEGEALIRHGFLEYKKGIECFTEQMAQLQLESNVSITSLGIVLHYLNYVAQTPDHEVLEFFASLPNSESGREKLITEYAPRLSREDIDNIYLLRTTERIEEFYMGTNLEYSRLRCSEEELDYIEQCKRDCNSTRGKLARQEKYYTEEMNLKRFGSAARFPCEILEENIVIYGAGKFGQGLYNKIYSFQICNIVQWIDKDYSKYQLQGICQVDSPDQLGLMSYDQLVIAVVNPELAADIRSELLAKGIPDNKIIWMSTDVYRKEYAIW